ncbi:hypothetical protein LCGC14_1902430 [marine sediment metagenome]|uniref:Uncharacterized protein n=1 Tax=marine sediment metagenome TaxID=412755 RepID=A0A0F9FW68_9ZZZZ
MKGKNQGSISSAKQTGVKVKTGVKGTVKPTTGKANYNQKSISGKNSKKKMKY